MNKLKRIYAIVLASLLAFIWFLWFVDVYPSFLPNYAILLPIVASFAVLSVLEIVWIGSFETYARKMGERFIWEMVFFWFADEKRKTNYKESLKDWKSSYQHREEIFAPALIASILAMIAGVGTVIVFLPTLLLSICLSIFLFGAINRLRIINSILAYMYGEQTYDLNAYWESEKNLMMLILGYMKSKSVRKILRLSNGAEMDFPVYLTFYPDTPSLFDLGKTLLHEMSRELEKRKMILDWKPKKEMSAEELEQGKLDKVHRILRALIEGGKILHLTDRNGVIDPYVHPEWDRVAEMRFSPPKIRVEPELVLLLTVKGKPNVKAVT